MKTAHRYTQITGYDHQGRIFEIVEIPRHHNGWNRRQVKKHIKASKHVARVTVRNVINHI